MLVCVLATSFPAPESCLSPLPTCCKSCSAVCGVLLLQGCKAAELAASMRLMAVQTMEADRKLLHTVCFDRDAPDALSDCQVPV
jgi:hypothetical protein